MLESAEERGRIVRFAKELGVEPRTARRWWKRYYETNEVPYKLSKNNVGRPSSFTTEHETYIRELLDKDPQLYSEDIIGEPSKEFMGFSISKTQLNHHLRNNMLVTIKKPTFEPEARSSADNLETRYEWFMRWKDSDVDFTKNYIFIDEAGFHINLRNNWARADTGTLVIVKTTKTKAPSHMIIGAIYASSVIHVAIKKLPPKKREASK
jgi:transposase